MYKLEQKAYDKSVADVVNKYGSPVEEKRRYRSNVYGRSFDQIRLENGMYFAKMDQGAFIPSNDFRLFTDEEINHEKISNRYFFIFLFICITSLYYFFV